MLEVNIRCKRYSVRVRGTGHMALQGLRFALREGELVCLVGPSGCGKTTLLNIIGGLDREVDGWVRLNGVAPEEGMNVPGGIGALPGGIAYVFQSPRLMPWLTVLDNVRLVLHQNPAAEARARALLEAMELGEVLDAYPNRLSGGMQRRVALARAFATEPRLLLMDEPFVSLDAPTADRLRDMLVELWQGHGSTVLFVTHDLREALALGDRVLFLSPGPGQVVLEQPVSLPRPRRRDDPEIMALQAQLRTAHPHLLEGRLGGGEQNHRETS